MDSIKIKTKKVVIKPETRPNRRFWSFLLSFTLGTAITVGGGAGFLYYKLQKNINKVFTNKSDAVVAPAISKEIDSVLKEGDGRINFLIVGFDNNVGYASDAIILASVNPETGHLSLFSIPRDLYVPSTSLGYSARINHVFLEADNRKPGSGGEVLKQTVGEFLDLNVHYYITVDWTGFVRFIDVIGGVDVNVPYDLNDSSNSIRIKKGMQHLNGDEALQFSRCRKGSCKRDFGRSSRQQILIQALITKISGDHTYLNPIKVLSILDTLGDHVRTDISEDQIGQLVKLLTKVDVKNVEGRTLDSGYGKPLVVSNVRRYGYVLKPSTGNFDQIKKFVHELLDDPNLKNEAAKVELVDATNDPGSFDALADKLHSYGYNITSVIKAVEPQKQSQLIDYSGGSKPYTVKYLELRFSGQAKQLSEKNDSGADIRIIIGQNDIANL